MPARSSNSKTPLTTHVPTRGGPLVPRSSTPATVERAILDLQRTAGNAAVADLLSSIQRDTPAATAPAKPAPAASPAIDTIPLDGLTALKDVSPKHRHSAVALVPKSVTSLPAGGPVSVLVHLHGINTSTDYEGQIGTQGQAPTEFHMGEQLQSFIGTRPDTRMIALLPAGRTFAVETTDNTGKPVTKHGVSFGGFKTDDLMDEAIRALVDTKHLPQGSMVGGVVLSAHSGGGLDMLRAAATTSKKRLTGMFAFESIEGHNLGAYQKFVIDRLNEAVEALDQRKAPADATPAQAEAAFQAQKRYLVDEAFRFVGESGPTYRAVYQKLRGAIYGDPKKNQKGWFGDNDPALQKIAGGHHDEIRNLLMDNYRIAADEAAGHHQIVAAGFEKALETLPSAGGKAAGSSPAAPDKKPTPPPGNAAPQPAEKHGAREPGPPAGAKAGNMTLDQLATLTGFGAGWLLAVLAGATPLDAALSQLIAAGVRDEVNLTDIVWYVRNPGSGRIASGDAAAGDEWRQIRQSVVRPALARARSRPPRPSPPSGSPAASHPSGPTQDTHGPTPSTTPAPSPKTPTTADAATGAKLAAHYTLSDDDRKKLGQLRVDWKDFNSANRNLRALTKRLEEAKGTPSTDDAEKLKTLQAEKTRLEAKITADWGSLDEASAALAKGDIENDIVVKGKKSLVDWYSEIKREATFLGLEIEPSGGASKGVHQELWTQLKIAEGKLRADPAPGTFGVGATGAETIANNISLAGLRPPKAATGGDRPSMHCYGLAVDINYFGNPFVGLSGGDDPPAARMIRHATELIDGKAFNILKGAKSIDANAAGEMWDQFDAASSALKTYLNLRDDTSESGIPASVTDEGIKPQYLGWWVARNGGKMNLKAWRQALRADIASSKKGDFVALSGKLRHPEQIGIMDLPKALVQALVDADLLWGGLYGGAKDIMHFDYRHGTVKRGG